MVVVGEVGVGDGAEVVVVLLLIKRGVDAEVLIQVAHVVGYYVHHHPYPSCVTCADKINKVLLTTEIAVQLV